MPLWRLGALLSRILSSGCAAFWSGLARGVSPSLAVMICISFLEYLGRRLVCHWLRLEPHISDGYSMDKRELFLVKGVLTILVKAV